MAGKQIFDLTSELAIPRAGTKLETGNTRESAAIPGEALCYVVPDKLALRALSVASAPAVTVHTLGGVDKFDGEAGVYCYIPTSTAEDDDIHVIAPDVGVGRWILCNPGQDFIAGTSTDVVDEPQTWYVTPTVLAAINANGSSINPYPLDAALRKLAGTYLNADVTLEMTHRDGDYKSAIATGQNSTVPLAWDLRGQPMTVRTRGGKGTVYIRLAEDAPRQSTVTYQLPALRFVGCKAVVSAVTNAGPIVADVGSYVEIDRFIYHVHDTTSNTGYSTAWDSLRYAANDPTPGVYRFSNWHLRSVCLHATNRGHLHLRDNITCRFHRGYAVNRGNLYRLNGAGFLDSEGYVYPSAMFSASRGGTLTYYAPLVGLDVREANGYIWGNDALPTDLRANVMAWDHGSVWINSFRSTLTGKKNYLGIQIAAFRMGRVNVASGLDSVPGGAATGSVPGVDYSRYGSGKYSDLSCEGRIQFYS